MNLETFDGVVKTFGSQFQVVANGVFFQEVQFNQMVNRSQFIGAVSVIVPASKDDIESLVFMEEPHNLTFVCCQVHHRPPTFTYIVPQKGRP